MEKRNFHLRIAKPEDAEEILKVYAPYVEKTAITFEYEVPSVEEFRGRIENTLQHYPYLVAEDETGILGYAYAGRFQTRAAYDWAVETSIYIRMDTHRDNVPMQTWLGSHGFVHCGTIFLGRTDETRMAFEKALSLEK